MHLITQLSPNYVCKTLECIVMPYSLIMWEMMKLFDMPNHNSIGCVLGFLSSNPLEPRSCMWKIFMDDWYKCWSIYCNCTGIECLNSWEEIHKNHDLCMWWIIHECLIMIWMLCMDVMCMFVILGNLLV